MRDKLVECMCPKCERKHKIKMKWTGRGVPRVYCRACREEIRLWPVTHAVRLHRRQYFQED